VKAISGALTALFNSTDAFYKADLFTFTFSDGTILRTTNADVALTFGGFTFASCAPIMERTKTSVKIGVTVDSMDITVACGASDTLAGISWPAAARGGYLDGGTVLVETAYLTSWPTVIGTEHVFSGTVSEVDPSRASVKVTVKSLLELLNQPFPRNVYQGVCVHTVYDSGCTLAKATYTQTGSFTGSPSTLGGSSANGAAAGYFEQGVITFTSGPNAGLKRTVKTFSGGTFTWALPLPVAPSAGATFSVFAGCDKTMATCGSKFSNLQHFGGQPFIPTPETVR
jgi:uncharacterized phage protein (TIGR02218 family)